MSGLFNENMTSSEADLVLFSAYDAMTREEWVKLRDEEYFPVSNIIHKKEFELGQQGWMMGG